MTAPHNHRPTREQVKANLDALFGPPMEQRTGLWIGAAIFLLLAAGVTVGFVFLAVSDVRLKELFMILLGVLGVGCYYVLVTGYLWPLYEDTKLQKLRAREADAQAKVAAEATTPVVVGVHLDLPLIAVPSTPA